MSVNGMAIRATHGDATIRQSQHDSTQVSPCIDYSGQGQLTICIAPSKIALSLGVIAAFLVVLSVASQLVWYLTPLSEVPLVSLLVALVDLDKERGLPSFFSGVLLIVASQALAIMALVSTSFKRYWAVLSLGFLCMSFDELFAYHEMLIRPLRAALGGESLGYLYFAWVIPGAIGALLIGLAYINFLLRLPVVTRRLFLCSAALYLGGALIVESVSGKYMESFGLDLRYSMITTLEEALELSGLILFNYALLNHFAKRHENVRVSLLS